MRQSMLCLILIVLCFGICEVEAAIAYIDFFDGQVHEINSSNSTGPEDTVRIDYGYPGIGTTLNIVTGGEISKDCLVFEDGEVNLLGGEIAGNLFASNNSLITISDGLVGGLLYSLNDSKVSIYGGQFSSTVDAYGEITILGGTFQNMVRADAYGYIAISGGIFNDQLRVTQNSSMFIYGTDFTIDGLSVGYGPITAMSGTLSGILYSGEALNVSFDIFESASIVLIPEPATILLLGLGGLALLRRRKI